jgi:hypothetical protein
LSSLSTRDGATDARLSSRAAAGTFGTGGASFAVVATGLFFAAAAEVEVVLRVDLTDDVDSVRARVAGAGAGAAVGVTGRCFGVCC